MTALLIIIAAIVLLLAGYIFYGSWLAKQWGIDPLKKTPAEEKTDGIDYVPAKPAVLMGHHFSSIAGAGPINGPIQAAVFGWVPVFLWCVLGGIFFGGLQDFGSLFASIRHDGKSVGEIIKDSMGKFAKKLFIIFALLVLILVIASFVNVVAGTFFTPFKKTVTVTSAQTSEAVTAVLKNAKTPFAGTCESDGKLVITVTGETKADAEAAAGKINSTLSAAGISSDVSANEASTGSLISTGSRTGNNQTTAMISILFIVLAVLYGILTNRCGVKTLPATLIGIVAIAAIIIFGLNFGLVLTRNTWIVIIGLYIAVASLIPVWIMLQPRDYLSSFLLYAMMAVALCGIVFAAFTGSARGVKFDLPAYTGWTQSIGNLFPALFITVACGACSGFHSLIASGTTSKQLDSEKNAKAIGYGSMLIESGLGIISLIAIGIVSSKFLIKNPETGMWAFAGSPATAFGNGIALMFGAETTTIYNTITALLTLAVSVFALTSLDSATRLSRFMFSELFLKDDEETWKDAKNPVRKILANPLVGTAFMVIIGCILGGLKLSAIWGLFGAANQLLAGIALLAVAAWLGQVGKNNKMFIIPMVFMLAATLTQLVFTIIKQTELIKKGAFSALDPAWGHYFQLFFAAAMAILAVILVAEGIKTFAKQLKKN
ncbi:carbon starvation protein A [Treponema rectale]|uniref:Carbon starvation protein n=1 Tax=Treponema rectale TaxID=744512 RepID=A0A840SGA3_9SPIR|nr:carbon starvation protein A [Treponema rectale]MBB5219188.1 carbon starvation protein [Treponema rectale]QOS40916.1 carbon starvation protein A [Treponema rectale]